MIKQIKSISVIIVLISISLSNAFAQTTLKDAFKNYFLIGAAMNRAQIYEEDKRGAEIVKMQFNTITPENVLKWEPVHPSPDKYDFDASDRYVAFGEQNKMFIIGHALVWHNQTPDWVFKDEQGKQISRENLLKRMREHIHAVVGRYKGRIKGWDVVNEAINDDGTMRQSPWLKIIGEDFIAKAFQYAHEADPNAELYYNDYSLEIQAKRKGAIALMKKLLAQKIPIKAIGLQNHDGLQFPSVRQEEKTISDFVKLGLKVNITELDVDVLPLPKGFNGAEVTQTFESMDELNPYAQGLPDKVQKQLAERYAALFAVFIKHKKDISRVTFWNVTDGDSWLNGFPVRGRTNYPLLFDRQGKKKLAFEAVIESIRNQQ